MRANLRSCAGLKVGVWLYARPTTLTFRVSLTHFLITLCTYLGLPHPTIAHLSRCQCGHTIDDLSTHLFQCPCGNERTSAHQTLRNIVVTIALESETRV
jgi:hypothetical protein